MAKKTYTVATILTNNVDKIYPLMQGSHPDLTKVTDKIEEILNANMDAIRDKHGASECIRMLRIAEHRGNSAYAGTFATWQLGSKVIR